MHKTLDKNFIVNIGIILISLLLFIAFPIDSNSIFQRIVVNITFLLVIPALYIKIVLRKKLSEFGLTKGNVRAGIFWGALILFSALLIFYLAARFTNFSKSYVIPDLVRNRFSYFLLYQFFLVGFFTIIYEFFFRGFVMLAMEKYFGRFAMLFQFLLFLLFLMFTGGISWQMFYFILMAALSGLVVEKSRSIIYSIAATWIFILLADAWIIRFVK
jgi:membrane protease YdiL (CAAX protease family)